jgi:biotin synthase-like enzyme
MSMKVRDGVHDQKHWRLAEIEELYRTPRIELVFKAQTVHQHHDPRAVAHAQVHDSPQCRAPAESLATQLLSISTGENLLTTSNPDIDSDKALFATLGLKPLEMVST